REGEIPEPVLFPQCTEEELRELATGYCGIIRDGQGLRRVLELLEAKSLAPHPEPRRAVYELRSIYTVVGLIAQCALAREESRGAHYRADFPDKRPEFQKHSLIVKGRPVGFRPIGSSV
ncbi:MAG: hypothetical protein H5T84_06570, partial [Thermoleophilia bacterium]|nr:hypothetical protein [Thermoleophilia bacterium]